MTSMADLDSDLKSQNSPTISFNDLQNQWNKSEKFVDQQKPTNSVHYIINRTITNSEDYAMNTNLYETVKNLDENFEGSYT